MASWNLPEKAAGKKVALVYGADKESNLLGKLMVDKYGRDDVVFLTHVGLRNTAERNDWLESKITYGIKLLEGRVRINISKEDLFEHDGSYTRLFPTYYRKVAKYYDKPIAEIKNDFDHIIIDRTKTELELIDRLNQDLADPVEHIRTANAMLLTEYSELAVQKMYDLKMESQDVDAIKSSFLNKPFQHLKNSEVAKIYQTKDMENLLWSTNSCNDITSDDWGVNTHCGECASCLNRKMHIKAAGIEDKTNYLK